MDPSFVEKDWYAIRLVATIINVRQDDLALVFSGGTSLSKGYGLIQRFSEDLDFKVLLPEAGITRPARRDYRRAIVEAISALTWRVLDQGTRNDHTLVRHVHDLAALAPLAMVHEEFPELLRQLLEADATRSATNPDLDALTNASLPRSMHSPGRNMRRITGASSALCVTGRSTRLRHTRAASRPSVALGSVWSEHLSASVVTIPHRAPPPKLSNEIFRRTV